MCQHCDAQRDLDLMTAAQEAARRSTDRSRKVGAVIANAQGDILARGWNTVPTGVAHTEERHQRPAKYLWTEHAERWAIYEAARTGIRLAGATIYVPWYPCFACARAIVGAGLHRLVAYAPDFDEPTYGAEFREAATLFDETGVTVDFLEGTPPVQRA